MTMPGHCTMRAHAAARDRQPADAYAGGVAHGRRERRRLLVLGAVGAVALLGRRRLHPAIALRWAVLVAMALWPLMVLGVCIDTVHRQHGRCLSWPRTGALVATWAAVEALACGRAVHSPWPLAVPLVALGARAVEHGARVHGWCWRLPSHHAAAVSQGDAGRALPRSVVEPYRLMFTSNAEHIETRRYGDGRTVTLDTRTGEEVPDSFLPSW